MKKKKVEETKTAKTYIIALTGGADVGIVLKALAELGFTDLEYTAKSAAVKGKWHSEDAPQPWKVAGIQSLKEEKK